MKLIIAEKPSVARDIAATLGKVTRKAGYLEAGAYTISYAVGHLVGLADADVYDARYKSWRLTDLPIVPEQFALVVLPHAKAQYQVLARLLRQAQEVIVATDAGREGQLIYELIARQVGYTGPTRRLWLSSLTDQAIREAFARLRDNREYRPLYDAALSRAEADWAVGINATRCMTVQAGTLLPVGRVQTPTLAMIVERDLTIESFTPEPYFEVVATFLASTGTYKGKWTRGKQTRLNERDQAQAIVEKVLGRPGAILRVENKERKEIAPQLFDLTSLQRRANQLWGMTADQTLKAAQTLYERHKLITYPRTDSRYLTQDIAPTLPSRLRAATTILPDLSALLSSVRAKPGARVVQDAKVSDHHALLPTDKKPSPSLLGDERKIYELIARQTFAALLPDALWSHTRVETVVEDLTFVTQGRTLLAAGWRAAMGENEPSENPSSEEETDASGVPLLATGDQVDTTEAQVLDKQTKPPAHFTEASLLAAMEGAGRQIDNPELADAMKERGLGTPATRAATIEKLKRDGLIVSVKKQVTATHKGRALIAAIPVAALKSPELTGEWELHLKQMEKGEYARSDFMQEIAAFTHSLIADLRGQVPVLAADTKAKSKRKPSAATRTKSPRTSSRKRSTASSATQTAASLRTEQSASAPKSDAGQDSSLGTCPLCGAPISQTAKAYGCSAWRSGCTFTIWKEIAGHHVHEHEVHELLTKGQTTSLAFVSKAGKPFQAQLKLSKDGKTEFIFTQERAVKTPQDM